MAPKPKQGTPAKPGSGSFQLPPPSSNVARAPSKSAAITGDLPAWKCTGPSTAKAAKPSYLQVSQVQGKGAGKEGGKQPLISRPLEELAVQKFRTSVDNYVEGKLQECAKAGDAHASALLQQMHENKANIIAEANQFLANKAMPPQSQAAQAKAPAAATPCAAPLDATARAAHTMATDPAEGKTANISAPATASSAAQMQPDSSGSQLDSVRAAVKEVLAQAAAGGGLAEALSQTARGARPPYFEDKAVQTDEILEANQATVGLPAEPAPCTHTDQFEQQHWQQIPDSDDHYNGVGRNCQICGRFVRGGNEAMTLHQQTSSRCAVAQGRTHNARVPCYYCGRSLAANNDWAKQQHYQHCPGRRNEEWSRSRSAGWQDSYSGQQDSWQRGWDSDRWQQNNDTHHWWHWR